MKIRTGFVSNSSSSSFIIGLANDKSGSHIFDINDIRKSSYNDSEVLILDDYEEINVKFIGDGKYKLSYESFTHNSVSCVVKDGDRFTFLSGIGPDDDSFFYDENYYNCDYDKIDLSDFDADDIKQYELIKSLGGDSTYGAGRNG